MIHFTSIERVQFEPRLVRGMARDDADGAKRSECSCRDAVAHAREQLDSGAGVAILCGFEVLEPNEQRDAFRMFCLQLGRLIAQDRSGTLIREVQDRGFELGAGRSGRYADTRYGGDLHTDGAEVPAPVPDLFALLCVRQATTGGALQLVHVDELTKRLSRDVADQLRRPFHFDRRGDEPPGEPPTTKKPVLFPDGDGKTCVTYLRRYIELGHKRSEVPDLSPEQVAALDAFDGLLSDPDLAHHERLAAGELAVIDNKHVLHGRTTFEDAPGSSNRRLLLRAWIEQRATVACAY